jgi:hypothetical protein
MEDDVKGTEASIDMACFIRLDMLREENPFGSQLPLFPEVLPPPEKGMDPEDSEDRNKKECHNHEHPVEDRFSFRIVMGRVGDPLDEVRSGSGMAFPTGLDQALLGNEGFGVIRGKDAVKTMTVRATCD